MTLVESSACGFSTLPSRRAGLSPSDPPRDEVIRWPLAAASRDHSPLFLLVVMELEILLSRRCVGNGHGSIGFLNPGVAGLRRPAPARPSATVPRPVKELEGFQRVVLAPGAAKQVTITLDRQSLAYWNVASENWKVDPGKFVVYVGDSSASVPPKAEFTVG